jgi:hypothetical protein
LCFFDSDDTISFAVAESPYCKDFAAAAALALYEVLGEGKDTK